VTLFLAMFGVGLVTSIHCIFMCGGLVLTYAVKGTEKGPWYKRLVPHLAYQGSKIVSYAAVALMLGGLVALLGHAIDITPFRNWLMVVAGVYMVLLGIGMTGKVPILRHISPRPPKFLVDALSRNRKKASADAAEGHSSLATPISFGLLTGLMPCAPLIAAQASAMATGSPALGALAMVGFGLGTAPLMLVFGFSSSLLSRQFQAKLQVVAAVAVMVFGLVIFNRGLMVVGSPVTFDTVRTAVLGGPATTASASQFKTGADGVIEVPLTIQNSQFVPSTVSVPAGKPFRLIVDRKDSDAPCSAQLAIPQKGVLANLADNAVTKVNVPAISAGTYTLTCGMGMMSGSLSVGGVPGSASGSPLAVPAILVALFGSAYFAYRWQIKKRAEQAPAAPRGSPAAAPRSFPSGNGRNGAPSSPRRSGGPRVPVPAPAAAGAIFMGLRPGELVLASTLVVSAIVIGLTSGGFFR
jgi:sulfite exporter TauE/SafE